VGEILAHIVPAGHVARAVEQAVLPRAVGVSLGHDPRGIGQVLGALNDLAAAAPGIESQHRLGVLVRAEDEIGVALAGRPVIHAGDVIVAKTIDGN